MRHDQWLSDCARRVFSLLRTVIDFSRCAVVGEKSPFHALTTLQGFFSTSPGYDSCDDRHEIQSIRRYLTVQWPFSFESK